MKATVCLVAMSLALLAGCTSMQDKSAMAKPHDVDDAAYVAAVEQAARTRGVSVHWVNPPQKHVGGNTQL